MQQIREKHLSDKQNDKIAHRKMAARSYSVGKGYEHLGGTSPSPEGLNLLRQKNVKESAGANLPCMKANKEVQKYRKVFHGGKLRVSSQKLIDRNRLGLAQLQKP